MPKFLLFLLVLVLTTILLLTEIGKSSPEGVALVSSLVPLSSQRRGALDLAKKVAGLSLEQKIGQMMMVSISDTSLSTTTAEWLRMRHIGGVILLGKNVVSSTQITQLTRALQDNAGAAPRLFIAVDQEGGRVSRFLFLRELTTQQEITGQDHAFRVASRRGKELVGLGVNVNFSPVLDVARSSKDFVASRAFLGSDAARVATLGQAMIKGYQNEGVVAVAKHFPGHGGTTIDSHRALPVLHVSRAGLDLALAPFRAAVASKVGMVMVGHLKIPSVDASNPSSLSPTFIDGILRREQGYNGVIITDDLGMGAIMRKSKLSDAGVQAVKAGVDIVLAVRSVPEYDELYKKLLSAARSGQIPSKQIDASVARILLLKKQLSHEHIF